ncbi:hypothetical protein [Paraburkholderia caledonica]|uniref:DUF551 domain-containing protein n=1 Tax=Paraburkholderia caledonica TaxID=134536 RepID=A0AB73IQ70_9BURK|nr:hypothetical protein [Paraburkholderia caledonica]
MEGNQSDLTRDEASVAESVAEIQAIMLDWINVKPGPEAKSVWVRIEEKLVALATAQVAAVSDTASATNDTGNPEADRIIGRLMSADPEFDDCAEAAAFIRRLVVEHRGPDGFATWKDAAVDEKQKRVKAEHDFRVTSQELLTALRLDSVGELSPYDALRYMACRESAIERGLFATPEEYDAMVEDSLRKKGKEVLTGRGHNYGKKVAKDGSLYWPDASSAATVSDAASGNKPFAYYTDCLGKRVYSDRVHDWDEMGLPLTGDSIADVWHPLFDKPQAASSAATVSDQVATKSATPNRHAAGCGDGEDCRTCDALGLDPALYPRTEAATTAPIYQERTANGLWQDVSKELHDSIVAGRVRSEGVRIVYAAPSSSGG